MIDLNLPEPEDKECIYCFRKNGALKGNLIHWPSADFEREFVTLPVGMKIEPFSCWLYECQWCRAVETKRKIREKAREEAQ